MLYYILKQQQYRNTKFVFLKCFLSARLFVKVSRSQSYSLKEEKDLAEGQMRRLLCIITRHQSIRTICLTIVSVQKASHYILISLSGFCVPLCSEMIIFLYLARQKLLVNSILPYRQLLIRFIFGSNSRKISRGTDGDDMLNLKKAALGITSKFGLLNTHRSLVVAVSEEKQVNEALLKLVLSRVNGMQYYLLRLKVPCPLVITRKYARF